VWNATAGRRRSGPRPGRVLRCGWRQRKHERSESGGRGGSSPHGGQGMSEDLKRVVLVDDHQMFRTGVKAELGGSVEVVGEAVEVIRATRPDVVLLDVHLPGGGGIEVLRRLHGAVPSKFLALSVSDAAEDVIGVVRGGARGYVTKTISGPELTDAIGRVAEG